MAGANWILDNGCWILDNNQGAQNTALPARSALPPVWGVFASQGECYNQGMKTSPKTSSIIAAAASALAAACVGAAVTDQIQYFANHAKYYFPKSDITNMAARCCSRIKAIGGRLYIGLGNYTYNTGPTPVIALSPQTGTFTNEFSAGTEAIDDFKVFSNGKVYVPSLDPREASSSILGHFFIRSSTGDNGT